MTMNRIILHHTGGPYRPTADDLRAYHRLIDGDGAVHQGQHGIEANDPGRPLVPGRYAAHCKNLNSGSIGLSICAMGGAQWGQPYASTPVKPVQVDALIKEAARLAILYDISPDRRTILSHAEVEITLGVDQSAKWDFDYWPRGGPGLRDPVAIGDELRADIRRVMAATHDVMTLPVKTARPTLRMGSTGEDVRALQSTLGGLTVDGAFGPRTRAAVMQFQTMRELLPDGIVGRMTWAALAV